MFILNKSVNIAPKRNRDKGNRPSRFQGYQTRGHGGGAFGGSAPQISSVLPQIFLFPEKFVLNI